MGWHGVLIEGQPTNSALLKENRPNPNNFLIDKAVCKRNNGTFEYTAGSYSTAGNPHFMAPEFVDKWHTTYDNDTIKVPCEPLSTMLANVKVDHIDLFILDVEGGEFVVLRTMDFSVEVCVWLVEMDGTNP